MNKKENDLPTNWNGSNWDEIKRGDLFQRRYCSKPLFEKPVYPREPTTPLTLVPLVIARRVPCEARACKMLRQSQRKSHDKEQTIQQVRMSWEGPWNACGGILAALRKPAGALCATLKYVEE